jgi:hypothetical protein
MPTIRHMLDLSTRYLPERLMPGAVNFDPDALDAVGGVYPNDYGMIVWVPDDPKESAEMGVGEFPPELLAVQLYARGLGCDYVMFDCEGPDDVADLPTWEW